MNRTTLSLVGAAAVAIALIAAMPSSGNACAYCISEEDPDGDWMGWCQEGGWNYCSSISVGGEMVSCGNFGDCMPAFTFQIDGSGVTAPAGSVGYADGVIPGSSYEVTCAGDITGRSYTPEVAKALRTETAEIAI